MCSCFETERITGDVDKCGQTPNVQSVLVQFFLYQKAIESLEECLCNANQCARKLRPRPAPSLDEDVIKQSYTRRERKLLGGAYQLAYNHAHNHKCRSIILPSVGPTSLPPTLFHDYRVQMTSTRISPSQYRNSSVQLGIGKILHVLRHSTFLVCCHFLTMGA